MNFLIQITGIFGIAASLVAFQCKKHGSIMVFKTINELLFALQYFLLGAYTGVTVNIIGCIRNLVLAEEVRKSKPTKVATILFSAMFVVFGFVFWQGSKSILIIFAKVLSTLAYGNKNTTLVRAIILITTVCWLIYNIAVGSFAGAVNESLTLVSLLVGIVRFDLFPLLFERKSLQQ